MSELGKKHDMGMLYSDSQNSIQLAKNSTFHSRTKHIQVKYHFIRLVLEDGVLESWRYANKSCNQGETENMLNFNWSSRMMMKMRNSQVQKRSHCPANEAMIELLQSFSKWENVVCGA